MKKRLSPTLAQVIRAVKKVKAIKRQIGPTTRLAELGMESIDLAEVTIILEQAMGGELQSLGTGTLSTIEDLIRLEFEKSNG